MQSRDISHPELIETAHLWREFVVVSRKRVANSETGATSVAANFSRLDAISFHFALPIEVPSSDENNDCHA
jgi:hypothetical protein